MLVNAWFVLCGLVVLGFANADAANDNAICDRDLYLAAIIGFLFGCVVSVPTAVVLMRRRYKRKLKKKMSILSPSSSSFSSASLISPVPYASSRRKKSEEDSRYDLESQLQLNSRDGKDERVEESLGNSSGGSNEERDEKNSFGKKKHPSKMFAPPIMIPNNNHHVTLLGSNSGNNSNDFEFSPFGTTGAGIGNGENDNNNNRDNVAVTPATTTAASMFNNASSKDQDAEWCAATIKSLVQSPPATPDTRKISEERTARRGPRKWSSISLGSLDPCEKSCCSNDAGNSECPSPATSQHRTLADSRPASFTCLSRKEETGGGRDTPVLYVSAQQSYQSSPLTLSPGPLSATTTTSMLPAEINVLRWRKGELLGVGSSGRVYTGLDQGTGCMMAVKEISFNSSDVAIIKEIANEVNIMKSLQHPNIVQYLGTEADESHGTLYVFMEYVSGGSLLSIILEFGALEEPLTRVYTEEALHGLRYLHEHKIVHRDIKTANILVDDVGNAKLADFGSSKQLDTHSLAMSKSIKGTPCFMAPEAMRQQKITTKSDVWSLGCTIVHMITGEFPWAECNFENPVSAFLGIAQAQSGPNWKRESVSCALNEMLDSCFMLDSGQRSSAEALLNHRWILDEQHSQFSVRRNSEDLQANMMITNTTTTTTTTTTASTPTDLLSDPQQSKPKSVADADEEDMHMVDPKGGSCTASEDELVDYDVMTV